MILKSFFFSDIGNYRKINEDSVLLVNKVFQPTRMKTYEYNVFNEDYPLFALADGMGGHDKGEIASYSILKYIQELMTTNPNPKDMKSILFKGKLHLNDLAESNQSPGLGTTFSSIYFFDKTAHIYNVGDSRVYRIRKRKLERLTEDHSEVFELFKSGEITEDELRTHKSKNILTSALIGDFTNQKPTIFEKNVPVLIGDLFLLCTDGLWEGIPLSNFEKIFLETGQEEALCSEMINFSLKYGGMDNISFVLLKVIDL